MRAEKIGLPRRKSVALNERWTMTIRVCTFWNVASAPLGTQPVVLFGRTARRIRTQDFPPLYVTWFSARIALRYSSGVRNGIGTMPRAEREGPVRAPVRWRTNAQRYVSEPLSLSSARCG